MAALPLRPDAGFCLQAESSGTPPGRWYINMCRHRLVEMPLAYSGKVVDREHILRYGLGNLQVPFDLGSFRKLKARADGAKQTTYCIDAIFNPLIVQLFKDDAFCKQLETFRPFVVGLVLKRVEESIGVKLAAQKVKLVKSLLYKDGEDDGGNLPREFTELPDGDQDSFDAALPARTSAAFATAETGPLIEDLTPGPRQTAIKKGFLNTSKVDLYGPEGSKEGVLPENAGDPMGWMPKKLRQTCNIIDCNSPEYQQHEQKKRAAEEANDMNKEFRDTLLKDMDKWCKQSQADHWQDDRPEGAEPEPTNKYDVDYSRFQKIVDEDEKASGGAGKDGRDWYYDKQGNPQPITRPGQSQQPAAEPEAEPSATLRKGFLEAGAGGKVRRPLYPEGGSEQGRAAPSEEEMEEMLKNLSGLLGPGLGGLAPELGLDVGGKAAAAGGSGGAVSSTSVKLSRQAPSFQLGELQDADGLQLVVEVPGLDSMKGVDLNVTERGASLVFPAAAALKPLQLELPKAVAPAAARAKFSRKTQQITVRLPTALQDS